MGALWMSALARQYPQIRFVTMSPGGTNGTEGLNDLPPVKRFVLRGMFRLMLLLGKMHRLETGAKRYVDGLLDKSYKSGVIYASKVGVTGPVVDQSTIFADLKNVAFQNNANEAIHRFIK